MSKDKGKKAAKAHGAAGKLRKASAKIAKSPVVAEVVAATLVAAAAALRNPKKARAIAESAADEIGTASKQIADRGSALWKLAMDVARETMDAIAGESEPKAQPGKKAAKASGKKKAKSKK